MSRTVILNAFGGDLASNLQVVERPIPTPRNGEVLIRVTCRPVNPADVLSLTGRYPGFTPATFPAVPGLEGCGVVHDNNGVEGVQTGQRVIVLFDAKNGNGSWQEYVAVPKENIIPISDQISDATASQFLVNPITVLGMLNEVNAPAGSYILQTAAGSTLGRLVIAVAKHRGLKTINIVRRDEHVAELKALGGDVVINSTKLDAGQLASEVLRETGGEHAWAAFDCVGGDLTREVMSCVRNGGSVLIFGALGGITFTGGIIDVTFRNVAIRGFWLSDYLHEIDAATRASVFGEALQLFSDQQLVPHVGEALPLERVLDAVRITNEVGKAGKVLLTT